MLESTKMLSVNQTAAQIKLTEMWKVEKVKQYPIKKKLVVGHEEDRTTRSGQEMKYKETGRTKAGKQSFRGDAQNYGARHQGALRQQKPCTKQRGK
jgi:hypothetical protein